MHAYQIIEVNVVAFTYQNKYDLLIIWMLVKKSTAALRNTKAQNLKRRTIFLSLQTKQEDTQVRTGSTALTRNS